jgi:hypothetical protein
MLHPVLVEQLIVEATEVRRQAAERTNKCELCSDEIDRNTEPELLHKCETPLGFALHLIERIAGREKVRVQVSTAVPGKSEVTELVRRLECAAYQITAGADMFRPRQDHISEDTIGPGLEALQSALLHKIAAKPAESKSGLVVAEACSGDQAKDHIGIARAVTVSVLEAEIDNPTDG